MAVPPLNNLVSSVTDYASPEELDELQRLETLVSTVQRSEYAMSPKRQRFVEEYLIDMDHIRAYVRAGFSKSSAGNATKLLAEPEIMLGILRGKIARRARATVTAERVLEELARLAFANLSDYMTISEDGTQRLDLSGVGREQMAALQEITTDTRKDGRGEDADTIERTKIKIVDKKGALELLMKHLGMEKPQKIEMTGRDGAPLGSVFRIEWVDPPKPEGA
jgi:phage terminase small subunit